MLIPGQPSPEPWIAIVEQANGTLSLGLGDLTAAGLSVIGITKELVESWWGAPCNCSERQEKLNQFGQKVRAFLRVSPQPQPDDLDQRDQ